MTIKNISDVMLLGTLKKRPHVEVIGNYMSIDEPIREGVFYTRKMQLLDETHINMVRGLIKVRGLNPVHQQEQLVEAMLLRSTRTNIFFMSMPRTWFKVEEFRLE